MRCPKCKKEMELAGESEKSFSRAPHAVTVDYRCKKCGTEWCFDRGHQTLVPCNC
jgi:transposase-like protein